MRWGLKKRLNERRSDDGGLSRGRPDPDCGQVTLRSGPWRTMFEGASDGLESGAIAPGLLGCPDTRTRTQHSTPATRLCQGTTRAKGASESLFGG
jgi:hypothetical protein